MPRIGLAFRRPGAAGLLVLALIALTVRWLSPAKAAAMPAASEPPVASMGTGLRGLSPEALHRAPQVQPQAAPAPGELRRDGAQGWWISPGPSTRAELAQRLAEASGSRLSGMPLAPDAEPLPAAGMRLPSTEAAWQWLLGSQRSYVLRCAGLACEVWLLGTTSAASAPVGQTRPMAGASVATAQPAASLRPATSTPAAPQADPPGLFPAELPAEPR